MNSSDADRRPPLLVVRIAAEQDQPVLVGMTAQQAPTPLAFWQTAVSATPCGAVRHGPDRVDQRPGERS